MINNFYGDISSLSVSLLKPDSYVPKSNFNILSEEDINHSGFDHPEEYFSHSIDERYINKRKPNSNSISSKQLAKLILYI